MDPPTDADCMPLFTVVPDERTRLEALAALRAETPAPPPAAAVEPPEAATAEAAAPADVAPAEAAEAAGPPPLRRRGRVAVPKTAEQLDEITRKKRAAVKKWQQENRDAVRQTKQRYRARRLAEDPDGFRARQRDWTRACRGRQRAAAAAAAPAEGAPAEVAAPEAE